jgi:dipeptidyl aminopeptidase/acylaminoacyl peptidase
MGFYTEAFLGTPRIYPTAAFAQEGFMILRANPRGSTGYGRAFRIANYKNWGGKDFEDILAGIDYLISQNLVDASRMGIMGWSYGGYLTAWGLTQTKRFKAASAGAGPYNLVSMSGTTDLVRFMSDYLGSFLESPELYAACSPLLNAASIQTPCLLQHGLADRRVPVSQSYEFYHLLKQLHKTVSLILYPETGHGITDPAMHLDSLKRNLEWFKEHLLDPSL